MKIPKIFYSLPSQTLCVNHLAVVADVNTHTKEIENKILYAGIFQDFLDAVLGNFIGRKKWRIEKSILSPKSHTKQTIHSTNNKNRSHSPTVEMVAGEKTCQGKG